MHQHTESTFKTITLALIMVALTVTAAWGQRTQGQPAPSGIVVSRFGLPISRPDAQPLDLANRQTQPAGTPALSFTFGMIDFPGQMDSGVSAINDKREIVGGYGTNMVGDGVSNHGFLLKGTKFTAIDYPGAGWTEPNGINKSGAIVGQYGASFAETHGFKLAGKTYTPIDYPGSDGTSANGINQPGDIVGAWAVAGATHGFLLSKGIFTTIDVPGSVYTVAVAINKAGEIVGWYSNTGSDSHGFLYIGGTFTTIDYPGGYSQNYLGGINDKGVIVGGYGEPTIVNGVWYSWEHGFIYASGQFTSADAPFGPPAVTQPFQISNNGVIAGQYVDTGDTVYGYVANVGP